MNIKKFISLGILLAIGGILSIIILIWTSFLIFSYPLNIPNIYGQIVSINTPTIQILDKSTNQITSVSTNHLFQFDPQTHQNQPINIDSLSVNDQAAFFCQSTNSCQLVKMPPITVLGVIDNIENQTIHLSSNNHQYTFLTNDNTVFLNYQKQITTADSLSKGQVIFIYSDYSAFSTQTENIPALSIQVMT
ncbi:MAG TPA: hypothetical protein PLH65_03020 [bacterium]|jgi:hypothetical protein|nr:hypothetical protein [bacterium]HPN67426.1 hypothetical protein [bacterium]